MHTKAPKWLQSLINLDSLLGHHFLLQVEGVALHSRVLDNGNSHGGQQVVSSIRVLVNSTVESLSGVLTQRGVDQSSSTRVFLDEVLDVVDNTGDDDKTLLLGDLVEVRTVPDWQLLDGSTPVQLLLHSVQLLLLLLVQTLLDSVLGEGLQVPGQAELGQDPDADLGWVVLVPLQGVSVVRWELVVEVVVTLTEGNESGEHVVSWGSSVVEWLSTDPVSQGVDTESSLLDAEESQDTTVDETTLPVTPAKTGNDTRQHNTGENHDSQVVTMLENDDWVRGQVGDISSGFVLWVGLGQHPAHVGVPKTLSGIIWVSVGVCVSVVNSVGVGPPFDGTLHGTSTEKGEESSHGPVGIVGLVGKTSMVTGSDGNTTQNVQEHGKRHGLHLRRSGEGVVEPNGRHKHHQHGVQPVDVLVPVGQRPRLFGDVHLLSVLLSLSLVLLVEGLGVLGHLLSSDVDNGLGTHQLTTQTGGNHSGVFLVGAGGQSVERRDVHAFQQFWLRHGETNGYETWNQEGNVGGYIYVGARLQDRIWMRLDYGGGRHGCRETLGKWKKKKSGGAGGAEKEMIRPSHTDTRSRAEYDATLLHCYTEIGL